MEEQLKANDRKNGWKDCDFNYLLFRMKQEVAEVEAALLNQSDPPAIVKECADVANFAMMIAVNRTDKK